MPEALTILAIDDSESDQQLYRRALRATGHVLSTALTAEDGLTKISEVRPDVILLDYMLPDLDGLTVLKRLTRQSAVYPPIVMLTGAGDETVAVEAMKAGAADYLVKDTAGAYLRQLPGVVARARTSFEERSRARRLNALNDAILRTVDDGILGIGGEGTILFANPAAERMLGIPPGGVVGQRFAELLCQTGQEEKWQNHPLSAAHGGQTVLCRECDFFLRTDGTSFPAAYNASSLDFEESGRFGWVLAFQDVTERKAAEEAVYRRKDELEFMVQKRTAELRANKEALLHSNRELRALVHCNHALLWADDEETLFNDICRIVCDQAGYRMAWVGYAEQDEAKTIRSVASAGGGEAYLAQAKLTWADTERGRGPSVRAIRTGKSAWIQDFTTAPQAAPWREGAALRGFRSSIALPLKNESANTFGILNIYSTVPNAFTPDEIRLLEELAGDLAFGVTALRGRIARKMAENEIAQLNRELQHRLEALDEATKELETFSYSVSHDLKTPLRAIDGFISLLKEEYRRQLAGEGERYLEVVRKTAARMQRLIDGLLNFISLSRREMQIEQVDVGALAREVFEELRAVRPERAIRLRVGDLPPARCDRDMLRQALANLLDNAIKFTAPQTEASIEIGGAVTDDEHIYFVRDNGVGFDMRYIDKLFGVFLRLHGTEEFEGAGIGLAIVKRIVGRHGGRVWAEGRESEGATFHFTLPVAGAE